MRGFSKAIIAGNLTRDPELRSLPSGTSVCSFSVAVNRVYKSSSGEQQESVSFINCSAWGKAGEIIKQYAHKGSGLLVSGRLEQRSWEDKNTGQKRSQMEIVVEDFTFIGGGTNGNGGGYNGGDFGGQAGASYGQGGGASAGAGEGEVVPQDLPSDDEIDPNDIPF